MATTELTIRQLADEGGTTPIAPVTVTDAVLKGDGTTLTEELTALNNGLTSLDGRSFTRSTYRQWDANNLTEQGVYHVALTSHGPTSSTSYGVMLVIKIGTYGAQFFVTGTTTFARYRNDGSWLNWQALN